MGNIAFTEDFGLGSRGESGIQQQRNTLRKWLMTFGFFSRLYPFVDWMKKMVIGNFVRVYGPRYEGGLGASQRLRNKLLQNRLEDLADGKSERKNDMMQRLVSPEV